MNRRHLPLLLAIAAFALIAFYPSPAFAYCGLKEWQIEIGPKLKAVQSLPVTAENIYDLKSDGNPPLVYAMNKTISPTLQPCQTNGSSDMEAYSDLANLYKSWTYAIFARASVARIRGVRDGYGWFTGKQGMGDAWAPSCIPAYMANLRWHVADDYTLPLMHGKNYPYEADIVALWHQVASELGMTLPAFGVSNPYTRRPYEERYRVLFDAAKANMPSDACKAQYPLFEG